MSAWHRAESGPSEASRPRAVPERLQSQSAEDGSMRCLTRMQIDFVLGLEEMSLGACDESWHLRACFAQTRA